MWYSCFITESNLAWVVSDQILPAESLGACIKSVAGLNPLPSDKMFTAQTDSHLALMCHPFVGSLTRETTD